MSQCIGEITSQQGVAAKTMTIECGISKNKTLSKVFTAPTPFSSCLGIYDYAIRLFRQFLPLKQQIRSMALKLSHLEANKAALT